MNRKRTIGLLAAVTLSLAVSSCGNEPSTGTVSAKGPGGEAQAEPGPQARPEPGGPPASSANASDEQRISELVYAGKIEASVTEKEASLYLQVGTKTESGLVDCVAIEGGTPPIPDPDGEGPLTDLPGGSTVGAQCAPSGEPILMLAQTGDHTFIASVNAERTTTSEVPISRGAKDGGKANDQVTISYRPIIAGSATRYVSFAEVPVESPGEAISLAG